MPSRPSNEARTLASSRITRDHDTRHREREGLQADRVRVTSCVAFALVRRVGVAAKLGEDLVITSTLAGLTRTG